MDVSLFALTASFLGVFLVSLFFMPLVIKLSHKHDWYDEADHRKIHDGDIPRIGGVAIFLANLAGWIFVMIAFPGTLRGLHPLIAGAVVIHLVGLLDDFANLRARFKLVGQVGAAALAIWGGAVFREITIPLTDLTIHLGTVGGTLFSLVWIVGITNAVNLIDGMDGLSGGITVIAALSLAVVAWQSGVESANFLGLYLAAAVAGFLFFNFPPAKIFMGDSGSLFLGYMLAVLPIFTYAGTSGAGSSANAGAGDAFPAAISVLMIPLMDTLAAIIRRIRRRVSFYTPDREHLHHKLLDFGFPTRTILAMVYGVAIILGGGIILHNQTESPAGDLFLVIPWLLVIIIFIIIDMKQRKVKGNDY